MQKFKSIIRVVLLVDIFLVILVIAGFKVDDMTLSKGTVHEFNTGWTMTWSDGKSRTLEELPYLGKSEPAERIIMENVIPEEYFGMTMSFLSADKELTVWLDGKMIYEFGTEDVRYFGHTPGSAVNYIDIPAEVEEGRIRIEMVSPYEDYAARASVITVGERDILILKLLQENLFHILCNVVIIICGIIFFMLFLIQKFSRQESGGMQYLCGYCLVAAFYYSVETKALQVFCGNQTLYSVLVFLCLMLIPFFISLYYANGIFAHFQKRWKVLLGLISVNIVVQLVLQLTNVVDFMNMAFFSHALIALTVILIGKSYLDMLKERKDRNIQLGMIALLFMGIGGTIDIVRLYVVAVGDMGKFSRLGTTCFGIIMLYQHFSQVMKGYAYNTEENARLLKNEMELIEKQNEQLKAAKEQAEEARQEALEANAAKGRFLAHMSHEIRTPINAVLGMDTMILRESRELHIKEYALDIQNAGQTLLSLINEILDFSKIESGKLDIILVEYDFSSLIHDISNMIKAKAEAKRLTLNIHVDEKLPSKLLGDDVRIRQVLVNLLNNAVKYTQQGSVSLKVNGRIEGRKGIFEFCVEDTGIGIKEEDIEKLFKEFERIEEKRNRNIEGTGLGINITTQLLLLMGSRLHVESEYGKGSRFFFTLEQQIVDSTPVGNFEERLKKYSTENAYMAVFTAPDARVLVVDDNATNLKVFVSLLKCTKINVDVADSGKACLELTAKKHYDLIFMDHMMPEMDGVETLHYMKEAENNQCQGTPVVALTANAITGAKEMYLAEGFDAFLPKPINPEKLEQMVLRLLPRELLLFEAEEEKGETAEQALPLVAVPDKEELPMVDGVDWTYGFMHLPDKQLLLETVSDFCKTAEAEAAALQKFYEGRQEPDILAQYRIKVHSMKSAANLIGATVLGGMAKLLENASRDGNIRRVEELHDIFLEEWCAGKERLNDCLAGMESGNGQDKEEAEDVSVLLAHLELLRSALQELDIDAMDEAMAALEGFRYEEEVQKKIEQLSVYVINMDAEQGETLIEELKSQLLKEGNGGE